MARRIRIDAELVRRGMARSREHAQELIAARRVLIAGSVAVKPATAVDPATAVVVREAPGEIEWASRGAHKLLGAIAAFAPLGLSIEGARCLDAGASTGGFTDVLLRGGAREVVAVDVGYGQLIWRLQNDARVQVHDRTNVRALTNEAIGGEVDLAVADLSFISLGLVLPALAGCVRAGGFIVPMVKPQFEVGKDRIGAGGVVRDPGLRASAVLHVAERAGELGLSTLGVVASPLPGPSGNVEYFLLLQKTDLAPVPASTGHTSSGDSSPRNSGPCDAKTINAKTSDDDTSDESASKAIPGGAGSDVRPGETGSGETLAEMIHAAVKAGPQ